MKDTGIRIALRRKALGYSQEELAELIGTSQTQLSRYERGVNDLTTDVLTRIADVLDTTENYLTGRTIESKRDIEPMNNWDEIDKQIMTLLKSLPHRHKVKILKIIKVVVNLDE